MPTKEARKVFEGYLQAYLKEKLSGFSPIKINKSKLVIKRGDATGDIFFRYVAKSSGYILHIYADLPELTHYINHVNPPYNSNLLTDIHYSMAPYGENLKLFSNLMNDSLRLPLTEPGIETTCEWIASRLETIFLPRLVKLLELNEEAIKDVLKNPSDYAYPFLTIMKIIIHNKLQPTDQETELFLSKRISRNKNFDQNLLKAYLDEK